jgi:hypothetical protein
VEVARKQNLDRRRLGMKTDLALQHNRCPKHLTIVWKADLGLKTNTVVKTSLDNVGTPERVLGNCDASGLNKSLWKTDAFVLVT